MNLWNRNTLNIWGSQEGTQCPVLQQRHSMQGMLVDLCFLPMVHSLYKTDLSHTSQSSTGELSEDQIHSFNNQPSTGTLNSSFFAVFKIKSFSTHLHCRKKNFVKNSKYYSLYLFSALGSRNSLNGNLLLLMDF